MIKFTENEVFLNDQKINASEVHIDYKNGKCSAVFTIDDVENPGEIDLPGHTKWTYTPTTVGEAFRVIKEACLNHEDYAIRGVMELIHFLATDGRSKKNDKPYHKPVLRDEGDHYSVIEEMQDM